MNKPLLVFSLLLLSLALCAQDSIYTDRPTVTISPQTVKKNWFQFETGFRYESKDLSYLGGDFVGNRLEWINWNELLLRYGISDRLEIRVGQYLREYRYKLGTPDENHFVELAPSSIGLKWSIIRGKRALPDMSVLFDLKGPVLAKGDTWGAETKLLFSTSLFKRFALDYNIGYRIEKTVDNSAIDYSVVLSRMVSQKWKAFAEIFGFFSENNRKEHNFDFGLTYLINTTLQIDAFMGSGISDNSSQLVFGVGLSKLFLPSK